MRSLWNSLGDPSLHLLAIALILVIVAIARRPSAEQVWAEAPLLRCKLCNGAMMPGEACNHRPRVVISGFVR